MVGKMMDKKVKEVGQPKKRSNDRFKKGGRGGRGG